MTTPPAMPEVSPKDLEAVLRRSKENDALAVKIAQAIELINGVLDHLSEAAVALSFNGGKDCTVLLHLLAAVLYARHTSIPDDLRIESSSIRIPPDNTHSSQPSGSSGSDAKSDEGRQSQSPTRYQPSTSATHHQSQTSSLPYPLIKSIYITAPYPFEEMDNFVLESTSRYGLDLYRFGGGMKAALEEYLGCGGGKGVRGVLVGTRHGDPNGNVEPLAPTDPSWPAFLRVHPILDWSYNEIWQFLREFNVPYCRLYDEGFTSLGSTKNTVPNPHLQRGDGAFDPAWTLQDGSKERAGRIISSA